MYSFRRLSAEKTTLTQLTFERNHLPWRSGAEQISGSQIPGQIIYQDDRSDPTFHLLNLHFTMTIPVSRTRILTLLFILFIPFSQSCTRTSTKEIDPAFAQYISAFTSGSISVAGKIRIQFTQPFIEGIQPETKVSEPLISFSPSIPGELVWVDSQTLEYRPSEWLEQGENYTCTFDLGKIAAVPSALSEFEFTFTTVRQFAEAGILGVQSYSTTDLSRMEIRGELRTADVAKPELTSTTVTARQGGKNLPVSWTHSDHLHDHAFVVDSIARGERADSVIIEWNGKPIGAESQGKMVQNIPALGDFKVFFHRIQQQPEQYIVLQFSDPLDATQDLSGLIRIDGMAGGERLEVYNNEVRLYPPERLSGQIDVIISPGIKNVMGYVSRSEQTLTLVFEDLKPSVDIGSTEKVILPTTDGMVFPFKAVNLSAVDVRIIRIFENNIPQFLQVNSLSGSEEMRRVGRLIAKATVPLNPEGNRDMARWNTYYLDLDSYIRAEPGAIYRVEIGFRRSYSLYPCDESSTEEEEQQLEENDDEAESGSSYWDNYESGWYGDYEGYWDYDWEERDNPCSSAYYTSRRPVGRNILASDLGILVKQGTDQSLQCFVTNLKTTDPVQDAVVELLNLQQQVIATAKTNNSGQVTFAAVKGVPFLVQVKKGNQTGYLKLDSGHSLSLSTFDTGGSSTQKGLKGFLYGERGVWRPGDTLFLGFMLEDMRKTIPAGHPVQFELLDPRGKAVQKQVRSLNDNGIYAFICTTADDAPTGSWTGVVRVGGATFSKSLRIETIKPNRLKLNLSFGKERITSEDDHLGGNLTVSWLHGAPARNLRATVSATFTPGTTRFDRYTDYHFDDPVRQFSSEEQVIYDGRVDSEGKAKVPVQVTLSDSPPGMVNANFSVKAFEEGGDFSVDRFSIPYAPFDRFVGMRLPKGDAARGMLLTDTDHKTEVVTLDASGKPLAVSGLQWKVYKVSWRWWWERSGEDLSNFVGSESTVPVAEGTFGTGADGKGSFRFRVNYPEWGRYLVRIEDPQGGHATGKTCYIDWPGWANRAISENPGGSSMLLFALDKSVYQVGETCTVTIPCGDEGRILISIENGSRVLETHWVNPDDGEARFSFRTTPEMAPNAYLHITYLQPHGQSANDMPIRLYGVQPLFVEYADSHITPSISTANELAPEKPFDVRVCEKSGKAMTYTLAIVDEGLLDLTRFRTPDPWGHFFAREALGVTTWDMYDEVIGALSPQPDRLLSIGGSDEAGAKGKNKTNRFKPVVLYKGPFTLKPGECKTHRLVMPNYIGSVRVMVVARNGEAYGHAEKAVPVKKPLMVLAGLPRVLGPGEKTQLPVTVFAMDKSVRNVKVRIETNDLLVLSGSAERSMTFPATGDQVIQFPLEVANREGKATVKVTATSGSYTSSYSMEVEVRSPNPHQTSFKEVVIEAGKNWEHTFDLPGIAGTNTAMLEVSSIPAIDFGRRLKYLLDYPHGCLEQTTSGAFPQLYLADVMELDEKAQRKATDNIRSAIARIATFQNPGGGFGYWPGANESDAWATSYAGHFLMEAKKKGFALPSGIESAWLAYQKKAAQDWRSVEPSQSNPGVAQEELMQAYRLYTLALAGKPELPSMNRLRERPGLTLTAKWRLAAAYALAGQKGTAQTLIKNIQPDVAPYTEMGYTFGSETRDEAMIAETLILMGDRAAAATLIRTLSGRLSSEAWYSTQTTAYALLAVSRFASGELGKQVKCIYILNGKTSTEFASTKPIMQRSLDVKLKANTISLRNTSGNILYARLILSGKPAAGNEQTSASGMTMQASYQTVDGKPVNVSRIEQGTDFYALVTVTHDGMKMRYDELALTQVFPSGWEIINSRMDNYTASVPADQPEYQDIRDDRVLTYFDLLPGKSKTYRVKVNATYTGSYYLPGFVCEAMYDKTIQARTKGQWVEVVAPGVTAAAR